MSPFRSAALVVGFTLHLVAPVFAQDTTYQQNLGGVNPAHVQGRWRSSRAGLG